jgi:hypothetical protein
MTELEKITYAVIMASHRLRPYFGIQSTSHFRQGSWGVAQKSGGIRQNSKVGGGTRKVQHHL